MGGSTWSTSSLSGWSLSAGQSLFLQWKSLKFSMQLDRSSGGCSTHEKFDEFLKIWNMSSILEVAWEANFLATSETLSLCTWWVKISFWSPLSQWAQETPRLNTCIAVFVVPLLMNPSRVVETELQQRRIETVQCLWSVSSNLLNFPTTIHPKKKPNYHSTDHVCPLSVYTIGESQLSYGVRGENTWLSSDGGIIGSSIFQDIVLISTYWPARPVCVPKYGCYLKNCSPAKALPRIAHKAIIQ